MGTVDAARGVDRGPWRYLARMCGDASVRRRAASRFLSAAYFAFDRMARAVGAHGGEAARARSPRSTCRCRRSRSRGSGRCCPRLAGRRDRARARGGPALSLLGNQLFLGHLPHAHLDARGLHVVADGPPYPGAAVTNLAAQGGAAAGGQPLLVLALAATPAIQLADAAARAPDLPLRLVVARSTALEDWPELAALPVDLVGKRPAVRSPQSRSMVHRPRPLRPPPPAAS